MRVNSPDAYNEKKVPHAQYYFLACVAGAILAVILYKGMQFLFVITGVMITFVMKYWIHMIVIAVIILVARKMLFRNKMVLKK